MRGDPDRPFGPLSQPLSKPHSPLLLQHRRGRRRVGVVQTPPILLDRRRRLVEALLRAFVQVDTGLPRLHQSFTVPLARGLAVQYGVSGEKYRGFWWVVSDLRGGLDADERVEVAVACLRGE